MERLLEWISARRPCRLIEGDQGEPYLERYDLLGAFGWHLYLHRFVDSDPVSMRTLRLGRFRLSALVILMAGLTGCGGAPTGGSRDELPVACLVKPDPGPCRSNQLGFYYDYRDDRCKAFTHGGCAGRVPFPTLERCLDFCGAKR